MSKLDLSTTSCESDCRVENVEHTNEEDHLYAEIGSARKSKLSGDSFFIECLRSIGNGLISR